jgi:hypothetical protein
MVRAVAPHDRRTRRSFLKSTGQVATTLWATGPSLLSAQTADKLRLAIIGCGGRGAENLKGVSGEHVAALWSAPPSTRTPSPRCPRCYPRAHSPGRRLT